MNVKLVPTRALAIRSASIGTVVLCANALRDTILRAATVKTLTSVHVMEDRFVQAIPSATILMVALGAFASKDSRRGPAGRSAWVKHINLI